MELQSRWKSPVLWTAIGAQIVALLLLTGVLGSDKADLVNQVFGYALQIAVAIGILNNPADKENW